MAMEVFFEEETRQESRVTADVQKRDREICVTYQADSGLQTVPLAARFRIQAEEPVRVWMPWASPRMDTAPKSENRGIANGEMDGDGQENMAWLDPLRTEAFCDRLMYYGAPYYTHDHAEIGYAPFCQDVISLPMVTVVGPNEGVTIAASLDDVLLDLTVEITRDRRIIFRHLYHRLGEGRKVKFTYHIIHHRPSWKGGLEFLRASYPDYFVPKVRRSDTEGGGAYSSDMGQLDWDYYRRLGFQVNWKASVDFPYMGMFLPPVGPQHEWKTFGGGKTSVCQLEAYSKEMKEKGFAVLNYFNVTEFGTKVVFPLPQTGDRDNWEDGSVFLKEHLEDALMMVPEEERPVENRWFSAVPGRPYFTWEGAVVLDCGEPCYQEFLIQQAQRHLKLLPSSQGICIDRLDWLRLYNDRADDGVSMCHGRKTRSLYRSWIEAMERISQVFHKENKVVFCNNHVKRIDLIKDIDGIFDEFTYAGTSLNLTALCALEKPVIGWIFDQKQMENPYQMLQRFLYLGVFPMIPFPGNDHSIRPSKPLEEAYLKFAPYFGELKNKKWCLAFDAEAEDNGALVNLFERKDGYLLIMVFARNNPVQIHLTIPMGNYRLEAVGADTQLTWKAKNSGYTLSLCSPQEWEAVRILKIE